MLDSYHHVELNGVRYRLAEDSEGKHYQLTGEPLRPPNAVTVQGEDSQKFQVRPDVLVWSLTDWSGGEGQMKYNAQAPNRWRELTGVRAFDRPGTVTPGYYMEDTLAAGGGADQADVGPLAISGANVLYMLDEGGTQAFPWDAINEEWDAADSLAGDGLAAGAWGQIFGNGGGVYFIEKNTNNLWHYDGATATKLSDALINAASKFVSGVGTKLFVVHPPAADIWEIDTTGTPAALIDDLGTEFFINPAGNHCLAAMNGKMYVMLASYDRTVVREIVPTSAAGTGFGSEIASFPGVEGISMWSHGGILFIAGRGGPLDALAIFYLRPGGEYGTLGYVRPNDTLITGSSSEFASGNEAGTILSHFFATAILNDATNRQAVWQVDTVSGGVACLSYNEGGDSPTGNVTNIIVHDEFIFLTTDFDAASPRVMRCDPGRYQITSEVISPWHDFDLADEKNLSSLILSVEALPANWNVAVYYAIDGTDSWTLVSTYTTDSGTGDRLQVTTDSSTVTFRTLSIRIVMTYTGGGVPTTAPVILGLDARAQVVKKVRKWRLLLDMADSNENSAQRAGSQKIANLVAAGDGGDAVDFKDGYWNRSPGVSTSYDVYVDSYSLDLTKPGEGTAYVELLEVA